MTPIDIIVIVAIALIIGGAVAYIVKSKRDGKGCIGCPYASKCGGRCDGCSGNLDSEEKGDGQNE